MKRIRHELWILVPQDDGDCSKCYFHSNDNNDCTADPKWKKCTAYSRNENDQIVSSFYRYERVPELPVNSRTL